MLLKQGVDKAVWQNGVPALSRLWDLQADAGCVAVFNGWMTQHGSRSALFWVCMRAEGQVWPDLVTVISCQDDEVYGVSEVDSNSRGKQEQAIIGAKGLFLCVISIFLGGLDCAVWGKSGGEVEKV